MMSYGEPIDAKQTNNKLQKSPSRQTQGPKPISNFMNKTKQNPTSQVLNTSPNFKGRSKERKTTAAGDFIDQYEQATYNLTNLNGDTEAAGRRKSLFLKALADNHREIMKKPETNILLNALQNMKDVEQFKEAAEYDKQSKKDEKIERERNGFKKDTHTDSMVRKFKGAVDNFLLINSIQKIFEKQKEENRQESYNRNFNKNMMLYNQIKKGLVLKFQDIERFKIQLLKNMLMIALLIFAVLLRILIGLNIAQINDNAVHFVELQKISLAPTYILGVSSLNELLQDGWIRRSDFQGASQKAFELG